MTTQKYRKSNKFSKTRSKKGGVKTRSGTDTSKVNKTNTRVIKKTKQVKQVKEEELCPICLEELQKTDNIPKLPCKHKFHKHCLMPLCSSKNNRDVLCPICRASITKSCKSDINPPPPRTLRDLDNQLSDWSREERRQRLMNMTMEERRQAQSELTRERRNDLARRRYAIARETPQQREQRESRESRESREEIEARNRYFHGNSQAHIDQNSRNILSMGLPLPESPPTRPYYPPGSPDYPPPPVSPPYDPNSSPQYDPNRGSPDYPPPLTVEDLRTESPPTRPYYPPGSPDYPPPPVSPPYDPNSPPQYDPNRGSPDYLPPPLTMEDLRTDEPTTYSYSNYDEEDEIVRRGRVGDLVDYIPNNQMGFIHYKISLDENGEKYLEDIGDINGYYNGGKKRKNRKTKRKSKKSKKSKRKT